MKNPKSISFGRLAGVLAALVVAGCAARIPHFAPLPERVAFSLLAVGDTGEPSPGSYLHEHQYAVARELAREAARRPVGRLLLLGDNFYPAGLEAEHLTRRIRENLVRPYCPFVALGGAHSAEVADACPTPAEPDRVSILAVLGNHDFKHAGSPGLQRHAVPGFVSNWHVPAGIAERVEDPAGVSLILFDSQAVRRGEDLTPLVEALRGSRGPWRVLVAHHPVLTDSAADAVYADRLERALARAGVPVHLLLVGHEHNLQLVALAPPAPALQVIAGSGSRVQRVKATPDDRRFGLARAGFARLDLVGEGPGARLVVSLFALPAWPRWPGGAARLVARHSVDRAGQLRDEAPRD